jgi:RNA polymerase sigma factor (sigma-70 family)
VTAVRDPTDLARNAALLERLLCTKGHLLRRQARRHAQLGADSEEALQSACALFIERYNPAANPLAWLHTTIKREAWRLAKRSSRRRELTITAVPRPDGDGEVDLSDAFPDPAELAESGEEVRSCRAALARLKPDQRTALLLLGLGYSYEEIGELRGWTYTKVNRCIAEGRAALRRRSGSTE